MIGFVSPEFRPFIRLTVRGSQGAEREVEAWVDTGFDGALVLPQDIIDELGLTPALTTTLQLADGSNVELQTYEGTVVWDGAEQRIQVLTTRGFILVGIRLFHYHQLNVTFTDGGAVSIEPLH